METIVRYSLEKSRNIIFMGKKARVHYDFN
ncbi:hypothetical protein Golob_002352 [Gossypium lobatum]|uniref:Uncharacterized protein n=1 Tax=Gossypium lobatum TaxID=34289 RepID=A0A7J8N504_9ROSI|nr:hypothetical protein [Gossypium lobatum]